MLIVALAGGVACSSDPTAPRSGRVNILLTDAPLDLSTVSAINVTLDEMILFRTDDEDDDGGGMEMSMGSVSTGSGVTLNLLDFQNGSTVVIASIEAPEGDYQKLRMRVASADLAMDDDGDPMTPDVVTPIFVPSHKVDIPVQFGLSGGETVDVTLDFDAELSVKVNTTSGQHPYILRPVITPVGVSRN